eukprot:898120-Pleurochrysis_carterae.AAC.1
MLAVPMRCETSVGARLALPLGFHTACADGSWFEKAKPERWWDLAWPFENGEAACTGLSLAVARVRLLPFTIALRGSCDLEQRALDGREVIEHVQRLGNEAREENQHRGEGDAGPERKRGVELREGAVRRVPGVGARDEGGRRRERVDDGGRLQGEEHHEEDEALEVA